MDRDRYPLFTCASGASLAEMPTSGPGDSQHQDAARVLVEGARAPAHTGSAVSAHPESDSDQGPENVARLAALRAKDGEALASLHGLLLSAARFEASRRRSSIPFARADEVEALAVQAAHAALVAVLDNLSGFRGASRFTTWASKFALMEAGVRIRRLAWQDREVVDADCSSVFSQEIEQLNPPPEHRELITAVRETLANDLTPHQQRVLRALAIDGVPIDVLSEQWYTTRGALYQALHDGRRRIRTRIIERGLVVGPIPVRGLGAT